MSKIVLLSGAGGVGKTSVLEALKSQFIKDGSTLKVMLSVTRAFYAKKGVANEATFLAMPEVDRYKFQVELFEFYCEELEKFLAPTATLGINYRYKICDRSPFDHLAYTIYGSQNSLSLPELLELKARVREIILRVEPLIVYFPYPQPWSPAFTDPDSFRSAAPCKNLIIASLIENLLDDVPLQYRKRVETRSTIEARANQIKQWIKS